MNDPSSSHSSPPDLSIVPVKNCQICGKEGHGNHFGAITCRACAAFFRRFCLKNNFKACKKNNKCNAPTSGWFNCKSCRLRRCKDIGMTSHNFQYDRDSFQHQNSKPNKIQKKIPPTMSTFLGRPNLIIYTAPHPDSFDEQSKYMIDMHFLIDKASDILKKGSETPIYAPNNLEKLALGLQQVRGTTGKKAMILQKLGKEEVFALWEDEMLKVAKWLTYFDEFQRLSSKLQMDMLKGVWHVFGRLEKLATTAIARREKVCGENMLMAYVEEDLVFCDIKNIEVDLSWCSRYTFEQLKFFDSHDHEKQLGILVQAILDLQPTDVELSYMLCQLCFHQVGKKYQGELLEVTDRFQDILSNNLHDYYVNRLNQSKYSMRISNMMKINNAIEQCIYRDKVKSELMKVFDIFHVKCSHPDLFSNA
ncbi:hypothetical protein GCK72_020082 [Caenorhabditis remanei]|uniref:Uncharacterized protein n=1 Tax=Caenorhabditis remanei TaxID=31234 RepID=A0A6A5GFQ5_CAERE|nr:hypothetical protein GCK72_020082 [Caenorhabditis remanei]KAF1753525.1 hypothetical protein GCK72_020082 [Caenorhabditis remanei]